MTDSRPSISRAVIVGGDIPLQSILNGTTSPPLDLKAFRDYCKQRFAEENLDFWLQVEFTLKPSKDHETFRKNLDELTKTFIVDGAEREINIPTTMKKPLLEEIEKAKLDAVSCIPTTYSK